MGAGASAGNAQTLLDGKDASQLMNLGKCAEDSERWEHMSAIMCKMAQVKMAASESLNKEERNMLSSSLKQQIGPQRKAVRYNKETTAQSKESGKEINAEDGIYLQFLLTNLKATCDQAVKVLSDLAAKETEVASVVFYHKSIGDYHRYVVEAFEESGVDKADDMINNAKAAAQAEYDVALTKANDLAATDPVLLGLNLNYCVFLYEIIKDQTKASELAAKAVASVKDEDLEKLDADTKEESVEIVNLLKDNIVIWKDEGKAGEASGEGGEGGENKQEEAAPPAQE